LDLFLIIGALLGYAVLYALALPYLPSWARVPVSVIGIVIVGGFIRSRARNRDE
jgi:hypothetical protein